MTSAHSPSPHTDAATTPSRRTLLRTGAWAAPAVSLAAVAPAYARSGAGGSVSLPVTQTSWAQSRASGRLAGWLSNTGTPGTGVPGTPGGDVVTPATGPVLTGFYADAPSSTGGGTLTAVWSVNVATLKPLTVAVQVYAPSTPSSASDLRQSLVLTLSKDAAPQTIGSLHHATTSSLESPTTLPVGSTSIAPGEIRTLNTTVTPNSTGLWTITAAFSYASAAASTGVQPFIVGTPGVSQST